MNGDEHYDEFSLDQKPISPCRISSGKGKNNFSLSRQLANSIPAFAVRWEAFTF